MTRIRQATTLAGVLALTAALSACSGSSGAEGSSTGTKDPSTTPQASSEPEIANPKNVATMDVCGLLPADAAAELGVGPQGERNANDLKPSLPDACVWEGPDGGSTKVSFTAFDDRSIRVYYENQSGYGYFKKLSVSGYPAVVAGASDPLKSGTCSIFLAVKKKQVVHSLATIPSEDTGKVDPCDLSKKALKLSLPTWPAAK